MEGVSRVEVLLAALVPGAIGLGILAYAWHCDKRSRAEHKARIEQLHRFAKTTLSNAKSSGNPAAITAIVKEFYQNDGRYSGMLHDGNDTAPFSVASGRYGRPARDLIPIILASSERTSAPITLAGRCDKSTKVFEVHSLESRVDGAQLNAMCACTQILSY